MIITVATTSGTKIVASCAHGVSASEFERQARREQRKQLLRRFLMIKDRGRKSLVVSIRNPQE